MEPELNPQSNPEESYIPPEMLKQNYQEALLKSGIQAANLLTELIELKMMPDPRAKEMAEVAIEVLKLVNESPVRQDNQE